MENNKKNHLDKPDTTKKNVNAKQIINALVLVIVVIFALQNLENIRVNLLFLSFEMPLFALIIIALVLGFVTAIIFRREK